jgi:hypothetical protein
MYIGGRCNPTPESAPHWSHRSADLMRHKMGAHWYPGGIAPFFGKSRSDSTRRIVSVSRT